MRGLSENGEQQKDKKNSYFLKGPKILKSLLIRVKRFGTLSNNVILYLGQKCALKR